MQRDVICEMCIAYNRVLLNQPEDERNQPAAMQAALTALEALGVLPVWQDIASASDPLEDCLVWAEGYSMPILAYNRPWVPVSNDLLPPLDPQPTHRMPLPAAPNQAIKNKEQEND